MGDLNDLTWGLRFEPEAVTAVVLGIMQDGGLPHAGCRCVRCLAAFDKPEQGQYAACLGLVDTRASTGSATASTGSASASAGSASTSSASASASTGATPTEPVEVGVEPVEMPLVYLFDATPDIKFQLNLLASVLGPHPERPERLRQPDGIFLTHAHLGHIGGLPQLGPEAMAVTRLPLYAPAELGALLQASPLWAPVVENLRITPLQPGQYVDLAADVQVTAVPVPHRDEWGAGTFAYKIQGPNRSLLYLPDIDSWDEWPEAEETLASVDVALVDGCFYSAAELNGRLPVAHPLIPDTVKRFAGLPCDLFLTHLNHTNPVLDGGSQARFLLKAAGVQVAYTGQMFIL